ncbi:MAG: hypothetical protein PHY93_01360 [Bacteriovorax sp.]|nr:hypothetical protein [Bacteriovorax sp.]
MKLAIFFIITISNVQLSYAGIICQKKNNFSRSLKDPESTLIADYTEIISSLKRVTNGKPTPIKNMSSSLFKNLNQTISGVIGQECLKNMSIEDSKLLALVKNGCFEKCRENVQTTLNIKSGEDATEATVQSIGAAVIICKSGCVSVVHSYEQFSDGYTEVKLKNEKKEVCTNSGAINSTHALKKLENNVNDVNAGLPIFGNETTSK